MTEAMFIIILRGSRDRAHPALDYPAYTTRNRKLVLLYPKPSKYAAVIVGTRAEFDETVVIT